MSRVNIIALVLLGLAVIWMFTLGDTAVNAIQQRALALGAPFIKTRNQIERAGEALSQPKMSYQELKDEYDRLLVELEQRRIETQALEQLYQDNTDLRLALQFRKASAFELTAAEVIGRETSTWYHTLTIRLPGDENDPGEVEEPEPPVVEPAAAAGEEDEEPAIKAVPIVRYAHGVEKDDPVVVDLGLVGKITQVTATTATVLLLTDEACKVTARVIGTNQRGILEGQPRIVAQGEVTGERGAIHDGPTLQLRYLEKTASNLRPGMEVFTSGQGGVFPPNVYLGKIVAIKEGEVTSEAEIQPRVDFESLKFVFVITGMKE